ncbi:hypothetical protein B0H13DRAFT_2040421 [Mycena leptocephala]|nr:hypothetical protein B0H13DRAFT_2040421 [Mycena leptocephala]
MSTNDLHNTTQRTIPPTTKVLKRGQYHCKGRCEMVGRDSTKQALTCMQIGHMVGSTSWQKSGRDEHMAGEAEIQAAEAQAYVQGTMDRVEGKFDAVVGAVTGDKARQMDGNLRQDLGKASQEANKLV